MTRKHRRSSIILTIALATTVATAGSAWPASSHTARPNPAPAPTRAGSPAGWQPWIIGSTSEFRLKPPPAPDSATTRRELTELRQLQKERTPKIEKRVRFWNSGASTLRWTEVAFEMILAHRPAAFPTRSARAYALLHIGMYDAMIAAWDSRDAYQRSRPWVLDPRLHPLMRPKGSSYADPRAAVAGAAEKILAYLFPDEDPTTFTDLADEAIASRLWGGLNYRSDVERARRLGWDVAAQVIAYGETDGHLTPWNFENQRSCTTPSCAGADEAFWVPTYPFYQYPPTDPMASRWTTWLLDTPDQLRPPSPPAYGSAGFMQELAEVKEVNDNSTPQDEALAYFWDDGPGTLSPAGHWNQIAMGLVHDRKLTFPQTARLYALMNAAIWDAFVAAWDAKYTYWSVRPITAIRERPTISGQVNPSYDPYWTSNLTTPPFPSYVSGHATESAAAARVLQWFFPDAGGNPPDLPDHTDAVGSIDLIADEVALSREIGGIHFVSDNEQGLILGRRIAKLAILHAMGDGAGS